MSAVKLPAISLRTWQLIGNAVLFQVAWLAIVLLHDISAWLVAFGFLAIHGLWFTKQFRQELVFTSAVMLVGFGIDALWFYGGIMQTPHSSGVPVWLPAMWMAFAITLPHSLSWLAKNIWLAAALGFVVGPASYFAGARLSDVEIAVPLWQWWLMLGFCWSLLLPCLLVSAQRFLHQSQQLSAK